LTASTAASGDGSAVGRGLLRREDRPLLTGKAEFVDDVSPAGTLHVAFLRSPAAHGRIVTLDLEPARAAPRVIGAFAARDLDLPPLVSPCETPNAFSPPRPLLAEGVVRFVGEPIAVAVADSRYAAEDALEDAWVELDPLEAVVDVRRALQEDAPRLHDHPSNVYVESRVEVGDVEEAFARAAVVVERELRHPRTAAVPIEPRGLVAAPDGDGVRIWSSTQGPHKLQLAVTETLGLDAARVRVTCSDVGGGFGQKAHVYPEELIVAALAMRLGLPLKWVEDRSENLLASSHAREQQLRVRAAADGAGRLLALDVELLADQGAYGTYPHGPTLEALTTPSLLPGPYRLGAYRSRACAVATNKCPGGAYRGVGFAVSAWAHERLMDVLAAELGLDRAVLRRRNLLRADELPYTSVTNQRYDSGDYHRALELALEAVGYSGFPGERLRARAAGRLVGLGVACYVEPTAMNSRVFKGRGMVGIEGFDGAHLALDSEGGATVWTTTPEIGQGSETTLAQLVADQLGLVPERVRVARSDTAVGGLRGTGTFASRSAVSAGGAIAEAGAELRRRLLDDAAERLEAAVEDLRLGGGAVYVAGSPAVAVTLAELSAVAPPDRYAVSAQFDPPAVAYPYATHACVAEVDPETGSVAITRYVVAEDCGRAINPVIVEGQTHGATAQGIATALYEEMEYDGEGQLRTGSLMDYLVPTAGEVPPLDVRRFETPSPDTVGGVKGVGEGGTIGAPGAVANAVADAVGVELNELPLTPERVLAAATRALEPRP
jgi:carbon-monoxide dehydrogenase large subunit